VYIRQYHNIRPYIAVTKIPRFDPTQLPYWDIYEREGTAATIPVGGTMAGEFYPGCSGGQRKLLLFELIYQRTMAPDSKDKQLLIVLDEPFAGVTDDFVPWIIGRLMSLREHHNVVLVTNDHVQTLMDLADNTITVSAIDRKKVSINSLPTLVDRETVILALSVGADYKNPSSQHDLAFFLAVEINGSLLMIAGFTTVFFLLFFATFWGSERENAAYILIAGDIIAFFAVNPYLLSLVDWRNTLNEECEALLHSSKNMSRFLKTLVCVSLIFIIALVEYGMVNACISGLESFNYMLAMFFDTGSTTLPFVCFGLYTTLPHQLVETLALIPFLFLIFFSTTFSPGAGLPGIKELRYLFSRFYFWCIVPGVQDDMEGCPSSSQLNMLLLCLTGLLSAIAFVAFFGVRSVSRSAKRAKDEQNMEIVRNAADFHALQASFFKKSKEKTIMTAEGCSPSPKSALVSNQTVHSEEKLPPATTDIEC